MLAASNQLDQLRIHKTDGDSADRGAELTTLVVGDVIKMSGGGNWAIQSITDNGSFMTFGISPALQGVNGLNTFSFETVPDTSLTYGYDAAFYTGGIVEGIYSETGYPNAVYNTNAYGIDLYVQEVKFSPDWEIVAVSGDSSSSGEVTDRVIPVQNNYSSNIHEATTTVQGTRLVPDLSWNFTNPFSFDALVTVSLMTYAYLEGSTFYLEIESSTSGVIRINPQSIREQYNGQTGIYYTDLTGVWYFIVPANQTAEFYVSGNTSSDVAVDPYIRYCHLTTVALGPGSQVTVA